MFPPPPAAEPRSARRRLQASFASLGEQRHQEEMSFSEPGPILQRVSGIINLSVNVALENLRSG
jgi:hypothetical protein